MHIVDRHLNPSGRNLANRHRFMQRAKLLIRKAVHESSASRSIKDALSGREVVLPTQGVQAPWFHRGANGGDNLLPDDRQYIKGALIPGPQSGGGSEGSPAAIGRTISTCSHKTRSCPILAKPHYR